VQTSGFDRGEVGCQTEESQATKQLGPFETYDLLFVRKLVDDLNRDNEVLFDNNTDLKTAFTFLVREHKKLQFELDKQKRNNALLESYRQQFIELK
jgi:hypothetical protein